MKKPKKPKPQGLLVESNAPWIEKLLRGAWYRGAGGSGKGKGTGLGLWGEGLYLTWQEGVAAFFAGRASGKGVVMTYTVKPGLKIMDGMGKEMVAIKEKMGVGPWDKIDDPMFARILTLEVKDLGYVGIINDNPADGLVLFDERDATLTDTRNL